MGTWFGGGLTLVLGGIRLVVRVALEDVPPDPPPAAAQQARGSRRVVLHGPGAHERR